MESLQYNIIPIPLQVDQGIGDLQLEVLLGSQFFGEVVRGERVGDADKGEQVGLERGTDRISKNSPAMISCTFSRLKTFEY